MKRLKRKHRNQRKSHVNDKKRIRKLRKRIHKIVCSYTPKEYVFGNKNTKISKETLDLARNRLDKYKQCVKKSVNDLQKVLISISSVRHYEESY